MRTMDQIMHWPASAAIAIVAAGSGLAFNANATPAQMLTLNSNQTVNAVTISPAGSTLAVSAVALVREAPNSGQFRSEAEIQVWDAAAGRLVRTFPRAEVVGAMEFSPDGQWLAATDAKGGFVLNVTAGTEKIRWRSAITDLSLSPGWSTDGQWLALPCTESASDSPVIGIALMESATGKRRAFFPVENGYARVARISPDGELLATVGQDARVRVFDTATGTSIFEDDTQGNLFALAFSPDGRRLVAGPSWGGAFLLYDLAKSNGVTAVLRKGHSAQKTGEEIHELQFTPDGNQAFSSAPEIGIRVWDARAWKTVAIVSGCTGRLWPDGSRAALWYGEQPNIIEIWNLPDLMKSHHGKHSPLEPAIERPPVLPDPATAARNECIDNQHRIDAAKQIWALDHGKHATDTPSIADLESYWGTNHWQPKCPAGGTYTIGTLGEKPKCSLPEHALPLISAPEKTR